MKRVSLSAVLLGALLSLPSSGHAQQETAAQMFWIYQEHVKPSMTAEYEAARKELLDRFRSVGRAAAGVEFVTVSSAEFGYAHVIPIEGFAGIDQAYTGWETAIDAMGQVAFRAVDEQISRAVDYSESYVIMLRSDLSYLPETVALDETEPYRRYHWWYVMPGMQQEWEAVAREFIGLYAARGAKTGWRVYQALTGDELPMYLVVSRAKDPYEYEAREKGLMERLGPQAQQLGAKGLRTARRFETNDGWFRPDLSFPAP